MLNHAQPRSTGGQPDVPCSPEQLRRTSPPGVRAGRVLHGVRRDGGRSVNGAGERLDSWADDLKVALEREIKALEAQRTSKRRTLFDAQDQIDQRREALIQGLEAKLAPKTHLEPLMAIRWALR